MPTKQEKRLITVLKYTWLPCCTNLVFWELIAACILLGLLQNKAGSWVDCLLRYQYGVPYLFEESIELSRVMIWLCPHMLISIFLGQQMEKEMGFSRLQIHRYGSRCQWWKRELIRIWGTVVLYYVGVYAGIIGISALSVAMGADTLSNLGRMLRSTYGIMLIQSILGMGTLLTMQSSAQLCFKNASVGIAVFFASVFFSIFCPIESLAKYMIGSWMMICRARIFSPEYGYNWSHVLIGAGLVFFVTVLSTYFCLRKQRNHW